MHLITAAAVFKCMAVQNVVLIISLLYAYLLQAFAQKLLDNGMCLN
jgi:hypothetical protein